jgi:hypothetical protein
VTTGSDGIDPDTKDWTWVLRRPCPECGFAPDEIEPRGVAAMISADAHRWPDRLAATDVGVRPRPSTWSTLEYGCHVRDVHQIFDRRLHLLLDEDDPLFPNWDQDQTAIDDDYAAQDPEAVGRQLVEAAHTVATDYAAVPDRAWSRRGRRSNGSVFTVATLAIYHLHDVMHHAWDVDARN